ncbi:MAG TPA: peptidoglycan-binding domain-containing protein, partial [Polyangia bacterium]
MREARPRPGAASDAEAPQSADAGDADGGGAGAQQQAARAQRAHKRRDDAADGEATAFNERHAAEVAEFNQLTQNACIGEDGKLDPAAVKDWQRQHNVTPDGKVGPKTVAAAGGKEPDGKSAAAGKQADAAKINQPAIDKTSAKKGPVDDILEWLDLRAV